MNEVSLPPPPPNRGMRANFSHRVDHRPWCGSLSFSTYSKNSTGEDRLTAKKSRKTLSEAEHNKFVLLLILEAQHKEIPEEIYCLIFSYLPSYDHKSWQPLSLVCPFWRKATLSCPHFRLDFNSWSPAHRVNRLKDEHLIQHSKLLQTMNLSEIDLDLCFSLTPAVLEVLASSPCAKSTLRKVRFAHCKNMVTDKSLRALMVGCSQLEELTLLELPKFRQCFKAIFVDGTASGNLKSC